MDNPRAEKVAVVEEVRQHFDDADAAILTEYRGLTVQDLATLRRSLRTDGGEYKIFKNTLVRLAAKQSGLEALDDLLRGPTAITFISGDAAAAVAKSLRDFSRTNPLLVIKGGVLGDKVIGPTETAALADLPSREVLLSRLAGVMAAPLQQFASLMQALPRNMAYGLAALRDQRAAGEPVAAPEAAAPDAGEPEAAELDATAEPEAAEAPAPEQPEAAPLTEQAEAEASAADDAAVQPEAEAGADGAAPTE